MAEDFLENDTSSVSAEADEVLTDETFRQKYLHYLILQFTTRKTITRRN